LINFSKIIERIENEITWEELPKAMDYIDEHHDKAWSKAIDRLDAALITKNRELIDEEQKHYGDTVLGLIQTWKHQSRIKDMTRL